MDAGPPVLYKVMLKKYLEYNVSAKQIEEFFGTSTWELTSRALKRYWWGMASARTNIF